MDGEQSVLPNCAVLSVNNLYSLPGLHNGQQFGYSKSEVIYFFLTHLVWQGHWHGVSTGGHLILTLLLVK